MGRQASSITSVDLVIVIDTSPSMKDEAQGLSDAAASAIAKAKSSCPSDLRVVWLGIEGTWKGTNFDQTVRAYLTQKAKAPESKLKGRKKGELKSSGAQEDAARAIEDISTYFDWRKGAKRAIFYLGDEALEGGGDKTEQKDIQAANLAIQKAQTAGVVVHTYFGTSNSKHREGIKSEYARVATATGGQAFTNKDTISGFSAVLEKVICGSRMTSNIKLKSGAVYVQDCVSNELSKLYTLDLKTGKATFVGEIVTEVSDIAFVDADLYGLDREGDKTKLVKIDLNSGDARAIGDIGFACAGLSYNRHRNTLYATTAKQLIALNLETGKGTASVTVADKDHNCGEVAFDAEGNAYITLIGYDKKKILASCNLHTGKVKTIGDIGFPDVASMEFVGDVLYGVTGNFFNLGKDGQLIKIDTKTGKGTLVTKTDPAARWAGISVYQPVTEAVGPEPSEGGKVTEPTVPPAPPEKGKVTEEGKVVTTGSMNILTIDTKNNCYVIDPNQMNNLQQNVATSFTFEKGTFNIRIAGGRYSYNKSKTEGEPFVLLWIYGVNGSRFINQNTGFEVGATWTTLNGYDDSLTLEFKERAVLHALFFDFNSEDNSGSIELVITSNKPFFNPQTLTVDSKRNCYVLDGSYLSTLQQTGANVVELNPGNYRLKIREGNASYWSDSKKFNIEPWALIYVKGGKFVTKLTSIEGAETWVSLNGLKDEVILEVKEKTTITGLFFDTFKDDNEGQIILAIDSLSATELAEKYKEQENNTTQTTQTGKQTSVVTTTTTQTSSSSSSSVTSSQSTGGSSRPEPVVTGTGSGTNIQGTGGTGGGGSPRPEPAGVTNSIEFTFRFNDEEFKRKWEEQLQKINTTINVVDEVDVNLEAKYWDQLEQWLLKNYEKHFKNLAIEIAKVRFSMDAYIEQMEFSVNQHFQGWSTYLEKLLEDRVNIEISRRVNQQISQYVDQTFEQKVRNNIGLIINNIVNKQELNQYVDQRITQQFTTNFEQNVRNNISLITQSLVNKNTEFNQFISREITNNFEQNVRNNISLITQNLVSKNTEFSQFINQAIANNFEQNVRNNISSLTQILVNNNTAFNNYVNQAVTTNFEQNIRTNISSITQSLVNNNTEFTNYINQAVTTNFEQNVRNNISVITQSLVNKNTEFNQFINQAITTNFEQNVRNNISVITQSLVNKNTEFNQYISREITNNFEQNVRNNINLITQNLVTNNTDFNTYVSQVVNNNFEQNVQNHITSITQKLVTENNEFNSYVSQVVNNNFEQNIQNNISSITQKLITNNTEFNNYVSQEVNNSFEQNVQNNVSLLVNNLVNKTEFNQYVDQRFSQTFEQNIHNHVQAITQNIINDNDVLNQFIDNRFEQTVNNNTEINHNIVNIVSNSTEINEKIRNEWNNSFISVATEKVDQLIQLLGGREAFIKLITQKVVNNNTDIDLYVNKQIDITYEQKVKNYVSLITQNIVNNNDILNQYVDRRVQHNFTTNFTNNNLVINQFFDNDQITQKIANIVINNSQINQKIENVVINSTEINNRILNFVVNSTEITNKINNVYRDVDIKIENVRNEWNQTFINLIRQYIDEVINIIVSRESFNLQVANIINVKVDELINQVLRVKNELTVLINNADRHLYEWTLGELMAIKGCLTDRQALVEQLVTFSTELRVKLDNTNCVDINTFKPFKPYSLPGQQPSGQPPKLPGNK